MPESTSTILDRYTVVQCFEPYWGNNKFVFRKLKKYSLTWFLHHPNSLSTSKVIPSLYNGHTWELTKFEESLNSKSLKKCKKYIKCAQQLKARYSWINQTVIPEKNGIRNCIFPRQKRNTLLRKYRTKETLDPVAHLLPFFLLLSSRPWTTAALCWMTCGVARHCCRGADVSLIWSLHFGLIGAAWAAAAVAAAAAVTATVFGPAWAGTAGPRLHEDNRAVVLWAEIRTVWRAVLDTRSGKLDLNMDEQIQISGMEVEEWAAIHCDVTWAGREVHSNSEWQTKKVPSVR